MARVKKIKKLNIKYSLNIRFKIKEIEGEVGRVGWVGVWD